MHSDQLKRFRRWFDIYSRAFLSGDKTVDDPLILKIDHTRRVGDNMRHLAVAVGLDNDGQNLAEAVGLFHDVGRFEQYRRFGTFNDRQSVNHAALGVEVLTSAEVLEPLSQAERTIICDAVRFHNALALPARRPAASMLFLRLIRDADKLDIWKLFADYFRQPGPPVAAIVQHLPDRPTWSPAIVDAILEGRRVRFGDMCSLNDFKLLQLSWVFDLQFRETGRIARLRGNLEIIAGTLPDDADIARVVAHIMAHLNVLETESDASTALPT